MLRPFFWVIPPDVLILCADVSKNTVSSIFIGGAGRTEFPPFLAATGSRDLRLQPEDVSKKPKHVAKSCKFVKYLMKSCVRL